MLILANPRRPGGHRQMYSADYQPYFYSNSMSVSSATATPRVEKIRLAGVKTTISWPSQETSPLPSAEVINGVVFLLPGAMISISEYNGLRDVILQNNHLVVSFFVNVLYPFRDNHRHHAQNVAKIFDELLLRYPDRGLSSSSYGIVGHSCGAKVGLLVASIVDPSRVAFVLALDPVDMNPIEFTNTKGSNLPMDDDTADIFGERRENGEDNYDDDSFVHVSTRCQGNEPRANIPLAMTCTDGGLGISKEHDGEAIHKLHPATICYRHEKAGHMCYCDHGGGWAGKLMPDIGTKEGNSKAKLAALQLLQNLLS